MESALVLIAYLTVAGSIGMAIRSLCWYRYQLDALRRVHECAQNDILFGRDWEWRYAEFSRQLGWSKAMHHFWLGFDTFITNDRFLRG